MYYKIEKPWPEKEFISKPDDGYIRPGEEETKKKFLEPNPPIKYDEKEYLLTDFQKLKKFKTLKN